MSLNDSSQKTDIARRVPMYASLITMIMAFIPFNISFFSDPNSFWNATFTDTATSIGSASYVMILLLAGANLSQIYRNSFIEDFDIDEIPWYSLHNLGSN